MEMDIKKLGISLIEKVSSDGQLHIKSWSTCLEVEIFSRTRVLRNGKYKISHLTSFNISRELIWKSCQVTENHLSMRLSMVVLLVSSCLALNDHYKKKRVVLPQTFHNKR